MLFRSLTCALMLSLSLVSQGPAFAQDSEVNEFYQQVIAALAGQPRPTFAMDAEALVTFTIAEDGTLAKAEIAQSSGSPPLDQTALQIVQDAAPFPVPPEGANRDLSITIKSKRPELGFGNLNRLRP
ncbi:MAG: energy transducer TonB [Pseudomonadota bacterium]